MHELKKRAVKATARFLIQRGYEVVETSWESEGSAIDVVAREDDAVVFVDVYARLGADRGMPEDGGEASRERREIAAATWLSEHDGEEGLVDLPIRFDSIAMMVIGESRALLRHHINCVGCEITAGETD